MKRNHGVRLKTMLTLVGLDFKIVTVERSKTAAGPWYRWRCTCPRQGGDWTHESEKVYSTATVHAVLHHEAHIDRGKGW